MGTCYIYRPVSHTQSSSTPNRTLNSTKNPMDWCLSHYCSINSPFSHTLRAPTPDGILKRITEWLGASAYSYTQTITGATCDEVNCCQSCHVGIALALHCIVYRMLSCIRAAGTSAALLALLQIQVCGKYATLAMRITVIHCGADAQTHRYD